LTRDARSSVYRVFNLSTRTMGRHGLRNGRSLFKIIVVAPVGILYLPDFSSILWFAILGYEDDRWVLGRNIFETLQSL